MFVIGGAQAVAALAFGTETVPRVDKIVGPGNAWVAEAKRQLFGAGGHRPGGRAVGDPGRSPTRRPIRALVAADLLSQAEHDADAYAVLVTPSLELAEATAQAVDEQLATLPRKAIAAQSMRAARRGAGDAHRSTRRSASPMATRPSTSS